MTLTQPKTPLTTSRAKTAPKPTPVELLWRAIFAGLRPPVVMSNSEWAEKHRVLSSETSFAAGKWKTFAYQKEPQDAPDEPGVVETVLMWGAQLGKSEIVNNRAAFHMEADPGPQLMVQPTVDRAKEYSEERIAPMIRESPALRRVVRDPRSRDSGNKILSKRYPGGNFALVGANAPSGLAGRPRRVIQQDEIDRFPLSAGTEGDPCALADKRAETFPNAVKVKTSTPTTKGLSRIEKAYELSDRRKWHVKHKGCGKEFVFLWAQVTWPEGKPREAFIECPCCKGAIHDEERREMVKKGRWVAGAVFNGIRGYWLNGINTLFPAHKGYANRIEQFAVEFLKAKDEGPESIRVWTNTFLAETYEEAASKIDADALADRLEHYEPDMLPEGVLIVTAAADVHGDRIELEFKGWGKGEECWGIQKKVLYGDTRKDEVWASLDEELLREFEREDGVKLKCSRCFIDMGFSSKRVLTFCAPRIGRGVYPCRGVNRVGLNIPPLLPAKPSKNNKARIPHWNVGVTEAKTMLHDRIELESGPRAMHFALKEWGYDANYFAQFAAEKRFVKYSFGKPYFIFEKDNNSVRNEALDLNVYNLAALNSLFPIAWNKLSENMKKQATKTTEPKSEEQAEAKPEQRRAHRRTPAVTVKPMSREELKAAVAETKAEGVASAAPAVPEPPKPPAPPKPIDYTEMMIARRPRRMGGGFVGRWR
jgi:phage terminase large subunit GpA-like protein